MNKTEYGNRGMALEKELNNTIKYYKEHGIGLFFKNPTPVKVIGYTNGIISKAFFQAKSLTDYSGVYKGRHIDIEAKETVMKYLPMKNIKDHQIDHMSKVIENGGISFIICRLKSLNRLFMLDSRVIIRMYSSGYKQISLDDFVNYGKELFYNELGLIDFARHL